MKFDDIYAAGKKDWIKALHTLSPELAQRVESDRLSLSHALHLIGVHTGAFNHTERKTMRYMTSDDVVFADIETAESHEAELSRMSRLHREVDAYVEKIGFSDPSGRAESRVRNSIRMWLAYDIEQHPERYADKPD